MKKVMVALGSNIEPMLDYLNQALRQISSLDYVEGLDVSDVYQTAPVGYADQSDFYNMVAGLTINDNSVSPHDLLEDLQSIELNLKRERLIKNGPRTIDLDIILVDDQEINTKDLIVPHPRMQDRSFVLVPLADVESSLEVPGLNKNVAELKAELSQEDLDEVEHLGSLQDLLDKG